MYKLIGTMSVKRLADGACIPFADGNADYEEYKQWLANGNTPEAEFTDAELLAQKVAYEVEVAKLFLDKSEKKVIPYYEFKAGDNTLEWYIEERSKARKFIRDNK